MPTTARLCLLPALLTLVSCDPAPKSETRQTPTAGKYAAIDPDATGPALSVFGWCQARAGRSTQV